MNSFAFFIIICSVVDAVVSFSFYKSSNEIYVAAMVFVNIGLVSLWYYRHAIGLAIEFILISQLTKLLVENGENDVIFIAYPFGGTEFKQIAIKKQKKSIFIDEITDEMGQDVTKEVEQFMNPYGGDLFYNQAITPDMLGYESLTFTDCYGESVEFDANDEIKFNLEN